MSKFLIGRTQPLGLSGVGVKKLRGVCIGKCPSTLVVEGDPVEAFVGFVWDRDRGVIRILS